MLARMAEPDVDVHADADLITLDSIILLIILTDYLPKTASLSFLCSRLLS
jgi:hypothetical protein